MLRVSQCLELPFPVCPPFTERELTRPRPARDTCQKLPLCQEHVGFKTRCLARCLQSAEIDLRGKILPTRIGEQVSADRVLIKCAQGTLRSFRHQQLLYGQTVIDSQEFT